MKVRLKPGWSQAYPELTVGNVYRVLEVCVDHLRLISDAGEPILFDRRAFDFVDANQPADWTSERGDEGELYAMPPELAEPRYFFERWHDGDPEVRRRLTHYVYELARAERGLMPDPPNRYLRLQRRPTRAEDPVAVGLELDQDGWEVRRVEFFADGHLGHASVRDSSGRTELAERPVSLEDLRAGALDGQLTELTRAEFEQLFERALAAADAAEASRRPEPEDMTVRPVEALAWVRSRPQQFFSRGEPEAVGLLAWLMADVIALGGGDCLIRKSGRWWVIGSDADWLASAPCPVPELFRRVVPAPEHGEHSMRGEVLAGAFCPDISVFGSEGLIRIAGEAVDEPGWFASAGIVRAILFRLPEESAQ